MKMDKLNKKLIKENSKPYTMEEAVNKDLAKEDALSLVSEFVKDVKKKFPNKEDKLEILRDISKTLEFYINEIENTSSSLDIGPMFTHSMELDTIGSSDSDSDDDDSDSDNDLEDNFSDSDDSDSALSRILRRRSE